MLENKLEQRIHKITIFLYRCFRDEFENFEVDFSQVTDNIASACITLTRKDYAPIEIYVTFGSRDSAGKLMDENAPCLSQYVICFDNMTYSINSPSDVLLAAKRNKVEGDS